MASALKLQDQHDTKSTIKFVEVFDKVFDCLNVMRVNQGTKKELAPYREITDWRFKVSFVIIFSKQGLKTRVGISRVNTLGVIIVRGSLSA